MTNDRPRGRDPQDTPMMRQYMAIKDAHPDAILFYRMGDFYEMFFEDAVVASSALDLTLTSRNKNDPDPIPMCGFPHHAAIGYVSRLIEQGYKVAICEQMEDPTKVKGLVKREVIRIVTPGVVLEEENLESRANNFLVALNAHDSAGAPTDFYALASMDASTFEFRGTEIQGLAGLAGELYRIEPREILLPTSLSDMRASLEQLLPHCHFTVIDNDRFGSAQAQQHLRPVMGDDAVQALLSEHPLIAGAGAAAISYIRDTHPQTALPPCRLTVYSLSDHMIIDEATKAHLELVRTVSGDKKGSLLWLLDQTSTPMGGRLLRHWINYPLVDVAGIRERQNRVEVFFQDELFRSDMKALLARIADIERLATRIGMGAATPRDLGVLRNSLAALPELNALLTSCTTTDASHAFAGPIDEALDVADKLSQALVSEPPVATREGGIFQLGFHAQLDELVETVAHAKDFIANLEERERARTGIGSLKVSYNKVFGYFILVTRTHLKNVPDDYVRKQTVANGERFVTPELEEWEAKVLTADDRRKGLEFELWQELLNDLQPHVPRISDMARRIASIDCARALAQVAKERDYAKPQIIARGPMHITEGRHPLVEAFERAPFVPNNTVLDPDGERLLIITGPNMAGKSTVMRQVALMTIMAQMGAFVPAAAAQMPVIDRLFTRVGASDNIARGASTFMVEMNETAAILRNATADSLVILDEVGRGTSTWDGLSIAWSVGEYLHDLVQCRTMFATHYHELVELGNLKPHAANYHVAAREHGDEVVFLRTLVQGGTSRSFGIQVAKMAGLPEWVVLRAREILHSLESEAPRAVSGVVPMPAVAARSPQLDLFAASKPSEVEKLLQEVDVNRLTPIEALSLLSRLKGMLET